MLYRPFRAVVSIVRIMTTSVVRTNQLITERSPYLLQHAHNPVNWYPWGEEAFRKAREEDRLIFLSIGYSTCHWCHVMERESFESEEVAKILNENFVSIKVDREERPDVDKVYMTFVQVTNGSGGWPLSVFLTPDLQPVFGGTYFPPDDMYGRMGFSSLLELLAKKWRKERNMIKRQGQMFAKVLEAASKMESGALPSKESVLSLCYDHYASTFDKKNKGFGRAPKFPHPVDLDFLLCYYGAKRNSEDGKFALQAVGETLQALFRGGIHDHVGKGFHRYSVDACWHVPHFEKMLYDQAQLMSVFSNYALVTGNLKEGIEDIADYVQNNLTHELGGFYSAEDADSLPTKDAKRKREGAFCVWTEKEIDDILGEVEVKEAPRLNIPGIFKDCFYVKPNGNVPASMDQHNELTKQNVLVMKKSEEVIASKYNVSKATLRTIIDTCKAALLKVRRERPKPHLDTKIMTSWNGLMISGLARASVALDRKDLADRAMKAVKFIKDYIYDKEDNKLLRCVYADEQGNIVHNKEVMKAFADDYSFVIQALLDLYESTFDETLLEFAQRLQDGLDRGFWNSTSNSGYYHSQEDPTIVVRMMEDQDSAEPMANSVAALNLLRLGDVFDKKEYRERAKKILEGTAMRMKEVPYAVPKMVTALVRNSKPAAQIVVVGSLEEKRVQEMLKEINSHYLPNKCLLLVEKRDSLLLRINKHLESIASSVTTPTVFVCKDMACGLPITDIVHLKEALQSLY